MQGMHFVVFTQGRDSYTATMHVSPHQASTVVMMGLCNMYLLKIGAVILSPDTNIQYFQFTLSKSYGYMKLFAFISLHFP